MSINLSWNIEFLLENANRFIEMCIKYPAIIEKTAIWNSKAQNKRYRFVSC